MITVKRDRNFSEKVDAKQIHGKYPFKIYLNIFGNSEIGKQIVIVSKNRINYTNINEIRVQIFDNEAEMKKLKAKRSIVKPNSENQFYRKYTVQETDILSIKDKIYVFIPV